MVQWLRFCIPSAGGSGSMPGQGTQSHMWQLKILYATAKTRHRQKKRKIHQSHHFPSTHCRMPPAWAPLPPLTQVLPTPEKNSIHKPSRHLIPYVSQRPQASGGQTYPLIITAAIADLCPVFLSGQAKISLGLPTTLCSGCYYWPHVTDEETEAQG